MVRPVVNTAVAAGLAAGLGAGPTVLVSHGIFHGCDGALLSSVTCRPDAASSPRHGSATW